MDETSGCETDSQIKILGKPTITGVVLPNLLLHLGMTTLDSKCWVIMTLIGLNHASNSLPSRSLNSWNRGIEDGAYSIYNFFQSMELKIKRQYQYSGI